MLPLSKETSRSCYSKTFLHELHDKSRPFSRLLWQSRKDVGDQQQPSESDSLSCSAAKTRAGTVWQSALSNSYVRCCNEWPTNVFLSEHERGIKHPPVFTYQSIPGWDGAPEPWRASSLQKRQSPRQLAGQLRKDKLWEGTQRNQGEVPHSRWHCTTTALLGIEPWLYTDHSMHHPISMLCTISLNTKI